MNSQAVTGLSVPFAKEKVAYVHRVIRGIKDRKLLLTLQTHLRNALFSRQILTGISPANEVRALDPQRRAHRQIELWSEVGIRLGDTGKAHPTSSDPEEGLWGLIAALRPFSDPRGQAC